MSTDTANKVAGMVIELVVLNTIGGGVAAFVGNLSPLQAIVLTLTGAYTLIRIIYFFIDRHKKKATG